MYKVTIQETPINESEWRVVATGTWTPGQRPQLAAQILPAEVLEELFKVTPSPTDVSSRNQVQCGHSLYAVVFRKLSRQTPWPKDRVGLSFHPNRVRYGYRNLKYESKSPIHGPDAKTLQ